MSSDNSEDEVTPPSPLHLPAYLEGTATICYTSLLIYILRVFVVCFPVHVQAEMNNTCV